MSHEIPTGSVRIWAGILCNIHRISMGCPTECIIVCLHAMPTVPHGIPIGYRRYPVRRLTSPKDVQRDIPRDTRDAQYDVSRDARDILWSAIKQSTRCPMGCPWGTNDILLDAQIAHGLSHGIPCWIPFRVPWNVPRDARCTLRDVHGMLLGYP